MRDKLVSLCRHFLESFAGSGESAYPCDDGVTIMVGDKVLDLARSSGVEVVATDEVRSEVEAGSV